MELLKIHQVWETDSPSVLCVEIDQIVEDGQGVTRDLYALVDGDQFGLAPDIREKLTELNLPVGSWDDCPINTPSPEPIPVEISRRQFFQQLAAMEIITKSEALAALTSGSIPAPLQGIIDQLPTEDDKFNAQMLVIGAQTFNRSHPLAEIVRQAMQWTVEQKDNFWLEAAKL